MNKKWSGEVNGLKVEFFQGETMYTADIESPVPFHGSIVAVSTRHVGVWRPVMVMVRFSGFEMSPFNVKRFAEALDVAWRIAAGMNEELGIENDEDIDPAKRGPVKGPIKPGTVEEKP